MYFYYHNLGSYFCTSIGITPDGPVVFSGSPIKQERINFFILILIQFITYQFMNPEKNIIKSIFL